MSTPTGPAPPGVPGSGAPAGVPGSGSPAGVPGSGAAPGYRAGRTLPLRAEWRRQATRRRTQLALGFLVALPLIILAAFQLGGEDDDPQPAGPTGGRISTLVDLATSGGLNFTLFTIFVSSGFLLVVVVALFFGDAVASEASWGSLRYLLAAPVPRSRLLTAKLLVAAGHSALAILLLAGTALLAGTLRYGVHPLRGGIAGDLPPGEGLVRIGLVLGYLAIGLLVVAGVAFLFSVLTDAPLGAVGGAVLLFILSSILDQISALGSLRTLLPTHYSDAWLGLLSTPMQIDDLVKGTISALVYATGCAVLAWWRFLRRDIVS